MEARLGVGVTNQVTSSATQFKKRVPQSLIIVQHPTCRCSQRRSVTLLEREKQHRFSLFI